MINSPLNRQVQKEAKLHYHHLTEAERYQIDAGISLGLSILEISKRIKRHRSTIFRELKRNAHISQEGYSAFYSQSQYKRRREKSRRPFLIRGQIKRWINLRIGLQWSPEQIVSRAKTEGKAPVGIETIYRYLYRDKEAGGNWWRNLRHSRGKRRKRFPNHRWPLKVPRPDLTQRPAEANDRLRNGDFERDLIVGAQRNGYLLTIVDRKTRFLKLTAIERATAEAVHEKTVRALKHLHPKTITNDNGCEFLAYNKTSQALKVPIYFTRPYASWERGTVENTNKLIRQYFPKKTSLKEIPYEKIKMVETLLNRRPRKTLGFRTPIEACAK